MANPKHVEILKQGVDVWNRWREENPEIRQGFERADLSEAELSGANLSEANLFTANLSKANLSKANLSGVNLTGADLSGANLTEAKLPISNLYRAEFSKAKLPMANLYRADLSEANLSGTDLSGAYLSEANFSKAKLSKANLSEAKLSEANLFRTNLSGTILRHAWFKDIKLLDIDLRKVENLEEVRHRGPSYIDISTIIRSRGKIPESFLRGCGVPENFIYYIPSLVAQPIQFYSCFISYSSKDQDFADRLYADLQNMGVRCWFAPEDMKIGDKIRDRIDQSIRVHDKLLLILSENSINSEWVEDEGESAYEQEKNRGSTVLFPIRLDDAVIDTEKAWAAKLRRSRHIGDFINWKDHDSYQKAFDRLLRDLKAEE